MCMVYSGTTPDGHQLKPATNKYQNIPKQGKNSPKHSYKNVPMHTFLINLWSHEVILHDESSSSCATINVSTCLSST